jgi:hypothetical protein
LEIPVVQTGLIPPFRSLGNISETKYVLIGIYFYPFLYFEVLKVTTPPGLLLEHLSYCSKVEFV